MSCRSTIYILHENTFKNFHYLCMHVHLAHDIGFGSIALYFSFVIDLQIEVPRPVIVPVPQPYPVKVPIPKPIAVPVVREITVPIEKPVPYPVFKKVPYPIEKPVPVPVEKQVCSVVYF